MTSGYTFEQPLEEEIPKDKKVQLITKPGIYEISDGPSGVSRVRLFQLYGTEEADSLFAKLLAELPWMEMPNVQNGVATIEPRLMVWYGEHPYSYAGVTHMAEPAWPDVLRDIKKLLEESTGLEFNSVLGNLYRTGKDFVAWHSDDEPELGENPVVASFSFGEQRNFELRKKPAAAQGVEGDGHGKLEYTEFIRMPLSHGSLLIMEGCMQSDWQHRVPVEYHDKKARINLTYRNIVPPPPK